MVELLGDLVNGDALRRGGYLHGYLHEVVRGLDDGKGDGCRKEEGLAVRKRGELLEDEAQVFDEAHVEETVGLVDHDDLNPACLQDPLLHVVDKAARGPDDDVDALPEDIGLLAVVDPSVDGDKAEARVGTEIVGLPLDLDGQLPRWGDDQGPGLHASGPRVLEEVVKDGDEKGGGLAGACLGLADEVIAGQRIGQRHSLDLGGSDKPQVPDTGKDPLVEIHVVKGIYRRNILGGWGVVVRSRFCFGHAIRMIKCSVL